MARHYDSVIEQIISKIYQAQSLEEGKKLMIDLIEGTKIKELDKKKMIYEVNKCLSLTKLQFYATNAMFKFEGLSVNSVMYN